MGVCAFTPVCVVIVLDEPDCVLEVGVIELLLCEINCATACEDCGDCHASGEGDPVSF